MGLVKYLLAFLLLLIPSVVFADATIDAGSCTRENINTALTTASASTGVVTVTIPECASTTHTSAITINMSSGYANVTSLIIRGASKTGTILNNSGWVITVPAAKKFRMTNMTLTGTRSGTAIGMITLSGGTKPSSDGGFRLDNLIMNGSGSRAVYVYGDSYGLIDAITSEWNGQWSIIRGNTSDGGNAVWAADETFGTSDAVYMENCTLTNTDAAYIWMVMDNDYGAKVVVRYNTLNRYHFGGHDATIGSARSTRHWEAYNNYFTTNASWGSNSFVLRGGTGRVFNNTTYSSASLTPYQFSSQIYVRNKRSTQNGDGNPWVNQCDTTAEKMCIAGAKPKNCTSDADCGGVSGACQQIDGNTDDTGWPCRDQLGRGKDQALVPVLFWNNKTIFYNSSETSTVPAVETGHTHIQNNRDYCYHATTMPATCNSVETSYTPYTCPHPLADPSAQGVCDSSKVGTEGYTLTGGESDTTAPTVVSVYVNGATLTINFSEPITSAADAGFTLDPSGADVTVDCPAVTTAATSMACTISRALVQSETATYAYSDTKVIDAASNALANIGATAITGNLTPAEAPTSKLTVSKTGSGCTVTSSPSGISLGGATASDDFDFNTNTVVTLSGYSENGWNAITYGGDCAANGTVTMSAAKECTATCTQVQLFP